MPEIREKRGVKIIAFYLPQYHTIPENDRAWGSGFTEWVNVKNAKPLFKGHDQPKVPLNDNYYDLLDDYTAKWQSDIAQENGIYGFCYYHYWFKGGKRLLEKPAERMLNNKEIDIPFCFCWANENWSKRWDGGDNEIIVEQDYGDETEWEKHFQYLLLFFKDSRYIFMDNAPLLLIYKPEQIPQINDMIIFFKKRCIEEGFSDCKIVFQNPWFLFEGNGWTRNIDKTIEKNLSRYVLDYYITFEPQFSLQKSALDVAFSRRIINGIRKRLGNVGRQFNILLPTIRDYDKEWESILNRKFEDSRMIAGAFVNWDNTPRKKDGTVYINANPEKFVKYLYELIAKVENSKLVDMLFLTAWNEWGEGSYLEPDTSNGSAYLNAVKCAVNKEREYFSDHYNYK